jgi:hypothetical protein
LNIDSWIGKTIQWETVDPIHSKVKVEPGERGLEVCQSPETRISFAKLASEENQIEDLKMSKLTDRFQSRVSSRRCQKNYEDSLSDSDANELSDSELSDAQSAGEADLSKNTSSPDSDSLKTEEPSSAGQASDKNMMTQDATKDKHTATAARGHLSDDNFDDAPMEDELALQIATDLADDSDMPTEMEINEDSIALGILRCYNQRMSMERTTQVNPSNEESLFVDDGEIAYQGDDEGKAAGDEAQQLLELGVRRGDTNMGNTHNDNSTSFHFFENDAHDEEENEGPSEGAPSVTSDSSDTDSADDSRKFDLLGDPEVRITSYVFGTIV